MRRVLVAATTAVTLVAPAGAAIAAPDRGGLQRKLDAVVAAGAVGALAEVRDDHGVWRERAVSPNWGRRGRSRRGDGSGPAASRRRSSPPSSCNSSTRVGCGWTIRWRRGCPVPFPTVTASPCASSSTTPAGVSDYRITLPLPPTPEFLDNRWRTWTATELIHRAVANPPTFEPPGSAFAYSNTGYLVLGRIVERVTGRSYGEEIERRIIRPLRLDGGWMPGTSTRIPGPHPHGYAPVREDDGTRLVDFSTPSWAAASYPPTCSTRCAHRASGAAGTGSGWPGGTPRAGSACSATTATPWRTSPGRSPPRTGGAR